MRTGSPPAPRTASSYCGSARSAYSRSPECGTGMAIRGGGVFNSFIFNSPMFVSGEPGVPARPPRNGRARRPSLHRITSTHPLNPSQRLALPVVPNFHQQQQHEHDRTHGNRKRKRDVAVCEGKIGRDMLHLGVHHCPENAQQKRDREREHGQQKRHREYARRNSAPARPTRTGFPHASKLHINPDVSLEQRAWPSQPFPLLPYATILPCRKPPPRSPAAPRRSCKTARFHRRRTASATPARARLPLPTTISSA